MATSHVHHVETDVGKYHHLFNLMFMSVNEIRVLQLCLSGQAIPKEMLGISNELKKNIDSVINMAITKDTQPKLERISEDEAKDVPKPPDWPDNQDIAEGSDKPKSE